MKYNAIKSVYIKIEWQAFSSLIRQERKKNSTDFFYCSLIHQAELQYILMSG